MDQMLSISPNSTTIKYVGIRPPPKNIVIMISVSITRWPGKARREST